MIRAIGLTALLAWQLLVAGSGWGTLELLERWMPGDKSSRRQGGQPVIRSPRASAREIPQGGERVGQGALDPFSGRAAGVKQPGYERLHGSLFCQQVFGDLRVNTGLDQDSLQNPGGWDCRRRVVLGGGCAFYRCVLGGN